MYVNMHVTLLKEIKGMKEKMLKDKKKKKKKNEGYRVWCNGKQSCIFSSSWEIE